MTEKKVKVLDFELIIDTEDIGVSSSLAGQGHYELGEVDTIRKKVIPVDNCMVFDIGAHIGYYTIILSKLIDSKGLVMAFEPEPNNYYLLIKNIKLNKCLNVIPMNYAVSDYEGDGILYIAKGNTGDNRIYDPKGGYSSTMEISIFQLDRLVDRGKVIFIKSDTQGKDFAVLRGAEKILKKYHPKLQFEFWPKGMISAGDDPKLFLEYLKDLGYSLYFQNQPFTRSIDGVDYINLFAKIS